MIYYGHQHITEKDIQAVERVLHSDWLTQGPAIEAFEKKVANYCGAKYAVAVTNATSALHIACKAAGLGEGGGGEREDKTDKMGGAERGHKLEAGVKKPKVVIPVHLAGQSCDMEAIKALADEYGFKIIEDASHATGADYKNTKVGSCRYSDMTVFSFHPVKIVTTGEGGIVLTNNKELYEKLKLYRSHGITRDSDLMTQEADGPWYYQQIELGFNYRMTDLQAALGCSQMDSLDKFVARRRYLVKRYNEKLKDLPLRTPYQDEATNPSWHIYIIRVDFTKVKLSKKEIFARMRDSGIVLNLHYIPVHTQPYYQKLGFQKGDFPVSEKYYEEAITLPLYYDLTDEQQDEVIEALKEVLAE